MSRSKDKDSRLIEQLARGRRSRYVSEVPVIIALDRTNNTAPRRVMATAITNETERVPIFNAPCECKVVRISANGSPYALMAAGGTVTVNVHKSVIDDTDIALLTSVITVGKATPTFNYGVVIDGILSAVAGALVLLDGQQVYATVAVSAHNVDTNVSYITLMVEWVPMDVGYPAGG